MNTILAQFRHATAGHVPYTVQLMAGLEAIQDQRFEMSDGSQVFENYDVFSRRSATNHIRAGTVEKDSEVLLKLLAMALTLALLAPLAVLISRV